MKDKMQNKDKILDHEDHEKYKSPNARGKDNPENEIVYLDKSSKDQPTKNAEMMRKFKRTTVQYKLVLDAMLAMKDIHPSAPEIHRQISKTYPGISSATVYSHLRSLADNGIIRIFSCLGSADRFDVIMDEHYHIKCEKCGAVCDLVIKLSEGFNDKVADVSGYLVSGHNIIFSGICPKCQKENQKT